jgi:hypothetical protein
MSVLRLLDDLPVTDDALIWPELDEMGKRLALLLRERLPDAMPVLLTGDWGAGKTSLLKRIQYHLEADSDGGTQPPIPSVCFDAWRYEHETNLLAPLTRLVLEKARAEPAMKRRKTGRSVLHWGMKALAAASSLGVRALTAGVIMDKVLAEVVKGMTASQIKKEMDAVDLSASTHIPEDETEVLREAFRKMVEAAWKGQRLIVFIDDLDRCSPEAAVSLIEGIRLLVTNQAGGREDLPCRFIMAMDRQILVRAIQHKFAGIGGYDGNRYLEKVFPLAFAVPPLHPPAVHALVEDLWPKLSDDAPPDEHARSFERRAALSNILADPRFTNPRLIKRCINRLLLVTGFEDEKRRRETEARRDQAHRSDEEAPEGPVRTFHDPAEAEQISDADRDLVRWIVTIERWPLLRRLLHERDDRYWADLVDAVHDSQDGGKLDGEARALLEERGAKEWLAKILQHEPRITSARRYRKADERLRDWGM